RRIINRVLGQHSQQDPVRDYLDLAIDIDLRVLCNDRQFIIQFWIERLERIMESIACRPRRFADDDLPQSLAQIVFANRGYGALPGPHIAYYQEMFREVYRVKDREEWEPWVRPLISRFLRSALHSNVRDGRRTVTISIYGCVAGQRSLEPSRIPV